MQISIDPIHRIKGVNFLTGLSRSTIYRLVQEGKFPAPIKIGERASGWKQSTIEAWIDSRESGASQKTRNNGGANPANNQKQRADYKNKPPCKPVREKITASLGLYIASRRQGGGND